MPRLPQMSISPLSIAAYVTWAVVSYAVWHEAAAWPTMGGIPARAVATALLVIFLAATLVLGRSANRLPAVRRNRFVVTALVCQVVATFGLLALGPQSTSPILLIIVATDFMLWMDPRVGWTLLLCLNVGFYVVLVGLWKADNPIFALLLYGGFQAFAALTAGSMKKAQVAADSLRLTNAQLLATRALLTESARDGERLRLSRELHDVAGHKLTALSLNLELMRMESAAPPRRELNLAYELSQEILSDIRAVVSKLRHHDGIDLNEALERLIAMFPRPQVVLNLQQGLRVAGTERAEALLRCAQEALTNVARHAGAIHAYVALSEDGDDVQLSIDDDGTFPGSIILGNGLKGLKERIESIHGGLTIERGSYGGCRLTARIPRYSPA